tara:strand:+ start:119 stop:568 length:450 start_codon:yes stop_codon:yes gene_type:complete
MNKNFLFGLFLSLFTFYSLLSFAEFPEKEILIANSNGDIKKFNVEIADNNETRSKGFMWRENIPDGTGMLFVWNKEAYRNFWMKNTPTSLDILFFDGDGKFLNVVEKTKPFSLDNIQSSEPSQYVLELMAGSAKIYNIYSGSQILNLNN